MSEPKSCTMLVGFCKRGHPKTRETTFERRIKVKGKLYIARECRICHAMRNNKTAPWSKFQSKSKWSEIRGGVNA